MFAEQRRAAEVRQGRGRRDGRRPLLRPARCHAALHRPGVVVRPVGLRRRTRLRRLLDPRLPGDPRVRHAAVPGPDDGLHRPVPHRQDAGRQLLHPRPDHRRGLLPRPAQHRPQGDGVPGQHRHRRPGVLRPRGGVLRLRLGPLRDQREQGLLRHRVRGRRLEHRPGRSRPTAATRSGTRAATSRSRRTTTSASCATRWSSRWSGPACTSSVPTTRSAPPARPRSTTSSTSCSRPPTT